MNFSNFCSFDIHINLLGATRKLYMMIWGPFTFRRHKYTISFNISFRLAQATYRIFEYSFQFLDPLRVYSLTFCPSPSHCTHHVWQFFTPSLLVTWSICNVYICLVWLNINFHLLACYFHWGQAPQKSSMFLFVFFKYLNSTD